MRVIPPNNTGLQVIGRPLNTTCFKYIEAAKRADGVVMLLAGQRLENTSVEYNCPHAKHFTKELVDMLLLIFPSDVQSNIGSLDFGPDAERRLTEEAENMRIYGNLQSLSKTKSLILLAVAESSLRWATCNVLEQSLSNIYRADDVACGSVCSSRRGVRCSRVELSQDMVTNENYLVWRKGANH